MLYVCTRYIGLMSPAGLTEGLGGPQFAHPCTTQKLYDLNAPTERTFPRIISG